MIYASPSVAALVLARSNEKLTAFCVRIAVVYTIEEFRAGAGGFYSRSREKRQKESIILAPLDFTRMINLYIYVYARVYIRWKREGEVRSHWGVAAAALYGRREPIKRPFSRLLFE